VGTTNHRSYVRERTSYSLQASDSGASVSFVMSDALMRNLAQVPIALRRYEGICQRVRRGLAHDDSRRI